MKRITKFFKNSAVICCFALMSPVTMANPNIFASGAILIEANTGTVLYGKNEHQPFYPASTTKLLTSFILMDGSIDSHSVVTQTQSSKTIVPSDSSTIGLKVSDKYSYIDGLYAILLGSDNFITHDMAVFHSGSIQNFSDKMNLVATTAGALNSNFVNPHGYHDVDHYTTPYDLAMITNIAFNSEIVKQIAGTQTYEFTKLNTEDILELTNSSKLLDSSLVHYNPYVTASKTGWHIPGGNCLVAYAEYDDISLIGVVLKSSNPNHYYDMNNLFEYGVTNFKSTYVSDAYNDTYVVENISNSLTFEPQDINISVNDNIINVQSYNIDNTNYISIRDFANLLEDTDNAFYVDWNSDTSTIELLFNEQVGDFVGSEFELNKYLAISPVLRNGELIFLQTYKQDETNYFRLRDLVNLANVDISWNEIKGITILAENNFVIEN